MEDNLTSADPLSYTTNGSRGDLERRGKRLLPVTLHSQTTVSCGTSYLRHLGDQLFFLSSESRVEDSIRFQMDPEVFRAPDGLLDQNHGMNKIGCDTECERKNTYQLGLNLRDFVSMTEPSVIPQPPRIEI